MLGIVGLLKTAAPVTIPFKSPGRAVVLLGGIGGCDETRFGGTQYAKEILKQLWGLPPALDLEREKRVQSAIREIVAAGLAESAHDLSDGGLAVALAECSFGPADIGAAIDLDSDLRPGDAGVSRRAFAHSDFDRAPRESRGHRGETRNRGAGGGRYNRERDGNPAARHDTGFLGNRNAESRL